MKVESTVYPNKIKILGNKVYVRDLNSIVEKTDENDNIIYSYDEQLYTKDEYIELLKSENDNLQAELSTTQDALNFIIMNGGV